MWTYGKILLIYSSQVDESIQCWEKSDNGNHGRKP